MTDCYRSNVELVSGDEQYYMHTLNANGHQLVSQVCRTALAVFFTPKLGMMGRAKRLPTLKIVEESPPK